MLKSYPLCTQRKNLNIPAAVLRSYTPNDMLTMYRTNEAHAPVPFRVLKALLPSSRSFFTVRLLVDRCNDYLESTYRVRSIGPGFVIVSCRFLYSANQLLFLYWDRYLPL
jgi:hypothetical protein